MKADQLDGLVPFVTVARLKSFTAAAAALEVSPQAVSQAVKALEERLGVRLLNRTTRSVSLNEAGERLMATVGPALRDLYEATETLQAFRDKPSGTLKLNIPRPAFVGLLQPLLLQFHQAYPDVHLELSFDDGFVDIVEKGFDAGIRLGESVAQDMVGVALSKQERVAIVGSPGYLAQRGTPSSIDDLRAHDCIRFRMPASGVVYRWELKAGRRSVDMEVNGPLTVNDTQALVAAALEGLGLAYLLESTVTPYLASGRLKRVLETACPSFPGFYLYYPSRRQVPAKLRSFIDFWKANRVA